MKLCDTCIYRNEDEYHKPCIVYRDDCEFYEKERGDMTDDLISRQAVDEIKELMTDINGDTVYAVRMSDIRQLLPVNPQEPKTVLEDIKAEIKEWYWQADKQAIAKDPCVVDAMIDLFIRTINAHISGEPKTGHWTYIRNSEVNGLKIVECSECGKRTYGSGNYCPNCGARMRSEDDNT